ncbi:MAG: DUF736 family protein [Pseudomonadota bacterium]
MSITGDLTETDDGAYAGFIASLTFDVEITLVPNAWKTKESHPAWAVMGTSPRGRPLRIGSAWNAVGKGERQTPYLSISIDVAGGQTVRVNGFEDADASGHFRLSPLTGTGA